MILQFNGGRIYAAHYAPPPQPPRGGSKGGARPKTPPFGGLGGPFELWSCSCMSPVETIKTITNYIAHNPVTEPFPSLEAEAWDDIVIVAIALGLAPLLYWRLSQVEADLPPLARAKLAVTYKAQAARNENIARQLGEILTVCAEHNVEVIVLKGALLAATVYPEAALRPMNDIDLLFRPDDLAVAGSLLEGLGYEARHKQADQGPGITKHLSTYRRRGNEGATPNPYLSAGGDRMIEPHGSLEESWFGLKVDITPGVWTRAVPLTLHQQPAHRLSQEDMLLHLAVHATFHFIMGASVFIQLHDIGRVVQAWSPGLDWSLLLRLAGEAQAQIFLYAALYWAKKLYKAAIPPAYLDQLAAEAPAQLVAYIHTFDAERILQRTQQPPLVTLGQRLRRGLWDRRETARWANSLAAKWKIWQTALAFHKTDTASLLKKSLEA